MVLCFRQRESKTFMKNENKKEPNCRFPDNQRPRKGATGSYTLVPLKDTNPHDASPRLWGNEQWEPDPTLRPCRDKQTCSCTSPHCSFTVTKTVQSGTQMRLSLLAWLSWTDQHITTSKVTWKVSDHHNNLLSGSFFCFLFSIKSLTVGKLIIPIYPTTPPPIYPLQFLLQDHFILQKQTNKQKKAQAVKIDMYCPNILKHIRKALIFSFIKQGLFWLGCHTWSDLLSLNNVCYEGLHDCMHVVYVCKVQYTGIVVLKNLWRGFRHSTSPLWLHRQGAHTKPRQKKTFRQEVRGGFRPWLLTRNPSMCPVFVASWVPKSDLYVS